MSEKLEFRPLTGYDAELAQIYLSWFENRELALLIAPFGGLPQGAVGVEYWMNELATSTTERRFTLYYHNQPVGDTGLTDIDSELSQAAVSIFIADPEVRGQGLGTQALQELIAYSFGVLSLKRLILSVGQENLPAIHVYRKLGFQEIASADLEAEQAFDGQPHHEMLMELLNTEPLFWKLEANRPSASS